jgi:hypothetical protein
MTDEVMAPVSAGTAGSGVASVYDFWLGLLPQFFAQLGVAQAATGPTAAATATATPLPFPADQIAKAATLTHQALQGLAQSYAPMLQAGGAQGLLGQWTTALPYMAAMQHALAGGGTANTATMAAWLGATPPPPVPAMTGADPTAVAAAALPLQQMQQAWLDAGMRMFGNQEHATTFERTFGALSDALGFGPLRKLQVAGQELMEAGLEQNQARARYAMLVQGAFAAGLDALLGRLAGMAKAGERVDSVLALLRLWALSTEEAVHGVLQSEQGLEATAAIARAGFAYRRKLQHVATIVADALDMATRRDLDEAFREIQALKRELRALRPAVAASQSRAPRARKTKGKSSS